MEGDTLPNALAALARTRERSLVEIDELLAAEGEGEGVGEGEGAGAQGAREPSRVRPRPAHDPDDDRVAFR